MFVRFLGVSVFGLVLVLAKQGQAGPQSLFASDSAARAAFLDVDGPRQSMIGEPLASGRNKASLFIGHTAGLFAPRDPAATGISNFGVAALRNLIAKAEAGSAQYDAVQYGARIKPHLNPTQMTIGEIYQWIDDTPGQPHAIGRYQFIPPTLRRLVVQLGIPESTRFSPDVQDRLADVLLEDAGLSAFLSGQLYQTEFMNNLAKIWAGLPNSSGRSHYHGYAGNKATMTWLAFQAKMDQIFPRG